MLNFTRRPLEPEEKKVLEFLLKSQYWSREQIKEYQLLKLRQLVMHAFEHVPFYNARFKQWGIVPEEVETFADFSQIPILTKRDIQQNLESLTAENVSVDNISLNSTGGSTGTPLNFYQDQSYKLWADAARIRAWKYVPGGHIGVLEGVLWGAIRDIGQNFSVVSLVRDLLRDGMIVLNTFDLDERSLKRFIFFYNIIKPSILRGYASSLYYVANYLAEKHIKIHKPIAVVSSTEVLHQRMRAKIERVFGASIFDSYGCREVSQIGTECEIHNGLHVVFENQYVELVGKKIVVTNLHNYAMPFIRYEVGDMAEYIDHSPCRCGRASPRIINLMGRDNDNIELNNGKVINGEFFEFLFFGIPDVIQYQVVYSKSLKEMIIKLQLADEGKECLIKNKILSTMSEKFDFHNVKILLTDTFDKTPTGKLRFVYMIE